MCVCVCTNLLQLSKLKHKTNAIQNIKVNNSKRIAHITKNYKTRKHESSISIMSQHMFHLNRNIPIIFYKIMTTRGFHIYSHQ